MATELFTNQASTTVSSGGTTAPAQGTVETWTVASSASFPAASSTAVPPTQFHVADPASAASAAEIVAVTNVSGTTWTVTRGAEGTTPVAHTAGFTVEQVITAVSLNSFQQAKPYQFLPEAYGAKGDGQVVADVATTSGSGVITSASGKFTSADVGKHIMVNGANGSGSGPLITTIASYQSATQVTLTATAGATATACAAVWGTDDTAAFNSAMSAMKTYALAHDYMATLLLADKIYIWAAAATQQSTPAVYNTQVLIPYPDLTGQSRKLLIGIQGAGDSGFAQYWESVTPNVSGTTIVSMLQPPAQPDATFGWASALGGPSGGAAFTGGFANTQLYIHGVQIYGPITSNLLAYDFAFLAGVRWGAFGANMFAPATNSAAAPAAHPYLSDLGSFTGQTSVGCRFPLVANNDDICGSRFTVEGYATGLWMQDHFTCASLVTVYVNIGAVADFSTTNFSHGVSIPNWSIEAYNGGLLSNGGGGGNCPLFINMDTETLGGSDPSYDVKDAGDFYGVVRVCDNGSRTSRKPVVVNGAPHLKIINDMMAPGHWTSPPAVPASTVTATNTAFRDAAVTISGGTVSAITVDGVATGLTATGHTVIVPAGKTIAITYSVAPTWVWWLL